MLNMREVEITRPRHDWHRRSAEEPRHLDTQLLVDSSNWVSACQLGLVRVARIGCQECFVPWEESTVTIVAEVPLTEAIPPEWEWSYPLRFRCKPLLLVSGVGVDQVSEFNWEFENGR